MELLNKNESDFEALKKHAKIEYWDMEEVRTYISKYNLTCLKLLTGLHLLQPPRGD